MPGWVEKKILRSCTCIICYDLTNTGASTHRCRRCMCEQWCKRVRITRTNNIWGLMIRRIRRWRICWGLYPKESRCAICIGSILIHPWRCILAYRHRSRYYRILLRNYFASPFRSARSCRITRVICGNNSSRGWLRLLLSSWLRSYRSMLLFNMFYRMCCWMWH